MRMLRDPGGGNRCRGAGHSQGRGQDSGRGGGRGLSQQPDSEHPLGVGSCVYESKSGVTE